MRFLFLLFLLFFSIFSNGQVKNDSVSTFYLEDQIYVSLHYNLLKKKPIDVSQNGFSGGFSIGFIKDIPINEDRNLGLGIGFGYLYNVYIQNIRISEEDGVVDFEIIEDFTSNNFKTHSIEVPIEFRWRTSTNTKYKFWRVYGGLKLFYNYLNKSDFKDSSLNLKTKNIDEFSKLNYGLFIAAGYSTWNLYIYYGVTPIFKDVRLNGDKNNMNDINIGLRFYIL